MHTITTSGDGDGGTTSVVASESTIQFAACTSSTVAPTAANAMSPVSVSALGCAAPLHTPGIFPTLADILCQIYQYYWGDQKDVETFQDWLEHFKAVSQLARWDDHDKLVYFTTSLRGTAKAFYRSCSHMQRSSYGLLVSELKKSFTPVQLTAVQTQMFTTVGRANGRQYTILPRISRSRMLEPMPKLHVVLPKLKRSDRLY